MAIGSNPISTTPIAGKTSTAAAGWVQVPATPSPGWTRSPVPSEGEP